MEVFLTKKNYQATNILSCYKEKQLKPFYLIIDDKTPQNNDISLQQNDVLNQQFDNDIPRKIDSMAMVNDDKPETEENNGTKPRGNIINKQR